jgi:hypothetical protein
MRKTFRSILLAAAVLSVASPALAGTTSRSFEPGSAVSKITLQTAPALSTAPATETFYWAFKTPGTLVDLVCTQVTAGTSGTSVSFDVQKNGTTMLSTLGTIVIGAGAGKSVDARKEITAVANCTRPVIKPLGTAIRVVKGDKIAIITTEAGSYSPHPTYSCTAVFLPDA